MEHETVIITQLERAETLYTRMKGLLGRKTMEPDSGLFIRPCKQIHTFFMKFPIDVVFLDKNGKVLNVYPELRPWRMTPVCWKASAVLEMAQGAAASLNVGDCLAISGDTVVSFRPRKSV